VRTPGVAAPAVAAFVMFGLPDGMLGVAWPAVRAGLGLPLDRLGVLLAANTAGFLLTAAASGPLARRTGTAAPVLAAGVAAVAGSLTILASGTLAMLAAGVLVLGACGGVIDPSLSTLASMRGRHRLMNLLHGGYGLGAALGPGLVAAAVALGSWRLAYVGLAVCQASVTCWWAVAARRAGTNTRVRPDGAQARTMPPLPRSAAALGLLAFFFASGLEISAGAWAATYLHGHLRESPAAAGLVLLGYWLALTASRLAVGALPHRLGPRQLVVAGCLVAAVGAAVLWSWPDPAAAVTGLVLIGCGTGPVFPALTSLTPDRVGRIWAPHLIGWQLAVGAVGAAAVSSAFGFALQLAGLQLTGPLLTGLAVVVTVIAITLNRIAAGVAWGGPAPARTS
jgi:fucose permease